MKLSPLFTWRSAVADADLPASSKLVGLMLSLHMSERGDSCFPGQTRLAKETSLDRRTVQRALRVLENRGWLAISRSGNRSTNDYAAVIPGQKGGIMPPIESQGRHHAAGGAAGDRIKGGTMPHKDDREVVNEDVRAIAEEEPNPDGVAQVRSILSGLAKRKAL